MSAEAAERVRTIALASRICATASWEIFRGLLHLRADFADRAVELAGRFADGRDVLGRRTAHAGCRARFVLRFDGDRRHRARGGDQRQRGGAHRIGHRLDLPVERMRHVGEETLPLGFACALRLGVAAHLVLHAVAHRVAQFDDRPCDRAELVVALRSFHRRVDGALGEPPQRAREPLWSWCAGSA